MTQFNLQIGIDSSAARKGASEVQRALDGIRGGTTSANRNLKRTEKNVKSLGTQLSSLKRIAIGAFAAFAGFRAGREFIQLSDQYTQVENRLRLVTGSAEELVTVQSELVRQAKESFVSLEAQAQVFQRVAKGAGEFGFSQVQALQASEALAKAVRLSGVEAASANSALIQLGQGIAAGALRGQELNSVLEQTPRVAEAIADALGVGVGELKALGEAGDISVQKLIPGLIEQLAKLDAETKKLTPTFNEAFTNLRTSLTVAAGDFAAVTGVTESFSGVITTLAEDVVPALADAFAVLSVDIGDAFDFVLDAADGIGTAFGSIIPDSIDASSDSTGFLANALQNLQNPIQSVVAILRILGLEIFTFFDRIRIELKGVFNDAQIAITEAQVATRDFFGLSPSSELQDTLADLRREQQGINEEYQTSLDFRDEELTRIIRNLETSQEEKQAILDQLDARRELLKATREQNLAALEGLRAGGRSGDVRTSGEDKGAEKLQNELEKFNAANNAAIEYAQTIEEINRLQAAGADSSAVQNALDDALETFERAKAEAEGGFYFSEDDVRDFNLANSAALQYEQALKELDAARAAGADQIALANALMEVEEAFQDATGASDAYNDKLEEAKRIVESTRTPQETLTKNLKELQELFDQGFINEETFIRAQRQLEQAAGQTQFLNDIAKAAAEDIQGAFRDLFLEGTDSLSDFADQFGQTLQRIAANFLANEAIKFLLGTDFGSGGSGSQFGGVLGGITDLFTGGDKTGDNTARIGETAAGFDPVSLGTTLTDSVATGGDAVADAITATAQPGGGFASGLAGIFSSITGGIGSTASGVGGLVSSFAGFFQDGGDIPRGQFGIAGESGPEIVTGPATVSPTGAMMQSAPDLNVSVVNVSNPKDAIDAVNTAAGDKAILNAMRRNPGAFKRELGIA